MDQWDRIESPEINRHNQLTFGKGGKIHNGEKIVASVSGLGKARQLYVSQ